MCTALKKKSVNLFQNTNKILEWLKKIKINKFMNESVP